MNPINNAISGSSWSYQWDNVAILISLRLCLPLEIVVINKVESSTPCTALNQNVFLLWNMDFYLSFWNKKAWAINSFGSVPSIRFIGVSGRRGLKCWRDNYIFLTLSCLQALWFKNRHGTLFECMFLGLLARQTFLGKYRQLNFIWVDEMCVYAKVLFPHIKVKELQNSLVLFKQKVEEDFHLLSHLFLRKTFFLGATNLWCFSGVGGEGKFLWMKSSFGKEKSEGGET